MASLENSYFLNSYPTFVSYHVETFGNMPIPTHEEWPRTSTMQEDRNSPRVLTEHAQTSQSYVSEPETPKITEASCFSEVPTSGTQNQTKKRDRWMTALKKVLVYWWKEYCNELETAKQHSLWAKIKVEIVELGNAKSLKQIKDKLQNLKDACKQARDNNKQTGKSPIFCPFYEDFDEIFAARDTVNLPYAKEIGVVASSHHVNDAASGEAAQSTNEGLMLFNFYLG